MTHSYSFLGILSSLSSFSGLASHAMILCSASISILNFCHRHTGKVAGLTISLSGSGSVLFGILYSRYFEAKMDLRNYWFMQSGVYLFVNMLGVVFLKDFSHLVTKCSSEVMPLRSRPYNETSNEDRGTTGLALFRNLDFYILALSMLLCGCVCNVIKMNTVVILISFEQTHYTTFLVCGGPVVAAFMKLGCGILSDRFIHTL